MFSCVFAAALRLASAVVVDGRLDEPAWQTAAWQDGIAVLADSENVYVGARGGEVSIDLSPCGTDFSYYRFSVAANGEDAKAAYFSENGVIQPDPYSPIWSHASMTNGSMRCFEMAIPLSAFYMTRGAQWRSKWLIRRKAGKFVPVDGFPSRRQTEDMFIRSVTAKISGRRGGKFVGELTVDVFSACAGKHLLKTSASPAGKEVDLSAGENRLSLGCEYEGKGRKLTLVALKNLSDGRKVGRRYPVFVDFRPITVKVTTPQYRNNFYPGQDVSKVAGTVAVAGGAEAVVTLSGPGFARQQRRIAGEGAFSFDTGGFRVGDAQLTVESNGEVQGVRIRNLPDTGRQMVWIENGRLVVNGKPVLRRNIYADGWMCGEVFMEKYRREMAEFCKTPAFERYVDMRAGSLVAGLEGREATRDVRPCDEYFRKVDALIEKNRDADFGYYYLADEPECRHISPVYLKHAYDYIADKDPYHPVLTATRGGKTYLECVDWAETHPYLDCYNDEDGKRKYNFAPNEMGRFMDAFEAENRPDKAVGFLPTCFAYRWVSPRHDYPTFDEYVLHTWAAMMRGGKSLWPYAGHDLGDRPALYEGTKYILSSFAALEHLVLEGRRTTFVRSESEEGVLYELPDEKMFLLVNYTTALRRVPLPECFGNFREFRGRRTFCLSGQKSMTVDLHPLETMIACTAEHDDGLPPQADVRARIDKDEAERKGRDNQLRGRYDAVTALSNFKLRGTYKLIDGTRDMLAAYSGWITNAYLEVSFTKFTPCFSRMLLWGTGEGVRNAVVSIRRRGEWQRLTPRRVQAECGVVELDFGEVVKTVKLRIDFPGRPNQRNVFEIYEIELPRCEEAREMCATARRQPVLEDVGVLWRLDGSNAVAGKSRSLASWTCAVPSAVGATPSGGFTISENLSHLVALAPQCRWLVLDFAAFHDKPERGYRAWSAYLNNVRYLGGTVTTPQPGIYTFRLPEGIANGETDFRYYTYGLITEFNSIALMERPATRVELDYLNGVIRVRAHFAEPCEDVSAEFLKAPSTGNLLPFHVNGTHGLDLKALDETLCVWGADVTVEKCEAAKERQVYVKMTPLGGRLTRPVFGNFDNAFESR